jgi:hypothetical protein
MLCEARHVPVDHEPHRVAPARIPQDFEADEAQYDAGAIGTEL